MHALSISRANETIQMKMLLLSSDRLNPIIQQTEFYEIYYKKSK